MDPPILSEVGSKIRITWAEPASNGAAITNYQLLWINSGDNSYQTNTALCDSSNIWGTS
jgi:hypothetical protein